MHLKNNVSVKKAIKWLKMDIIYLIVKDVISILINVCLIVLKIQKKMKIYLFVEQNYKKKMKELALF